MASRTIVLRLAACTRLALRKHEMYRNMIIMLVTSMTRVFHNLALTLVMVHTGPLLELEQQVAPSSRACRHTAGMPYQESTREALTDLAYHPVLSYCRLPVAHSAYHVVHGGLEVLRGAMLGLGDTAGEAIAQRKHSGTTETAAAAPRTEASVSSKWALAFRMYRVLTLSTSALFTCSTIFLLEEEGSSIVDWLP